MSVKEWLLKFRAQVRPFEDNAASKVDIAYASFLAGVSAGVAELTARLGQGMPLMDAVTSLHDETDEVMEEIKPKAEI